MSSSWPKSGPNFLPAYQLPGIPFVTSSAASEVPGPDSNSISLPVKVEFPYVTNFITVRNTGINELRVGFTADGVIAPGERRATIDADKVGKWNGNRSGSAPTTGRHYFLIPTGSGNQGFNGEIQTFNIRCKEMYFLSNASEATDPTTAGNSTSFSLFAGLTSVHERVFPILTGSSGFEGVG